MVRDMTVEAIKDEIGHLSDQERKQIFDWLEELEDQACDKEIQRTVIIAFRPP